MAEKSNMYTRDDLLKLGIYDLRELGREVGVPSPTTLKKEELVQYIMDIIYGQMPKKQEGMLRGRPARNKQKPYRKFVDLIDKIESPKVDSSFIVKNDDYFDSSFLFLDTISSKVASPKATYHNDALRNNELSLKKGVVCEVDGEFVARKFKFVESEKDYKIPEKTYKDYCLKENDIIDFLPDENGSVVQIIKINGNLVNRSDIQFERFKCDCQSKTIKISSKFSIETQTSNVVYRANEISRQETIVQLEKSFEDNDFSIVKVCFDRHAPSFGASKTNKKTEFFAESVGDEYETVAMTEIAISRAKFISALGYKTVLLIDNLAWLISVVETYPESVYGNFISSIAKLSKNANITVVCLTSHLPNSKVNELSNVFDNIHYE